MSGGRLDENLEEMHGYFYQGAFPIFMWNTEENHDNLQ
jgi:hypothetical protein